MASMQQQFSLLQHPSGLLVPGCARPSFSSRTKGNYNTEPSAEPNAEAVSVRPNEGLSGLNDSPLEDELQPFSRCILFLKKTQLTLLLYEMRKKLFYQYSSKVFSQKTGLTRFCRFTVVCLHPEVGSEPEGSGGDRWRPSNVDELPAQKVPYPGMLISKSTDGASSSLPIVLYCLCQLNQARFSDDWVKLLSVNYTSVKSQLNGLKIKNSINKQRVEFSSRFGPGQAILHTSGEPTVRPVRHHVAKSRPKSSKMKRNFRIKICTIITIPAPPCRGQLKGAYLFSENVMFRRLFVIPMAGGTIFAHPPFVFVCTRDPQHIPRFAKSLISRQHSKNGFWVSAEKTGFWLTPNPPFERSVPPLT
ncbi:unnamed protein product, partial [Nesidiocoris tenuis]